VYALSHAVRASCRLSQDCVAAGGMRSMSVFPDIMSGRSAAPAMGLSLRISSPVAIEPGERALALELLTSPGLCLQGSAVLTMVCEKEMWIRDVDTVAESVAPDTGSGKSDRLCGGCAGG
jgi:hypothetical protein